jgi:hypothetical protein
MTTGPFPTDSNRRKVIIVLRQSDIERCRIEQGATDVLFDEEAYILTFPTSKHALAPDALKNIIDAGLVRPGSILIQSPYDRDLYQNADSAAREFMIAKYMYFSLLCKELGAKQVSIEQIDLRTRVGRCSWSVSGHFGGSAATAVETQELERLRSQISLRDEFPGSSPDTAVAEQILKEKRLFADSTMRNLLDLRKGRNPLGGRTFVLNSLSEIRSNFEILGRLKIPSFLRLTADHHRIAEERHDYTLTVRVVF